MALRENLVTKNDAPFFKLALDILAQSRIRQLEPLKSRLKYGGEGNSVTIKVNPIGLLVVASNNLQTLDGGFPISV